MAVAIIEGRKAGTDGDETAAFSRFLGIAGGGIESDGLIGEQKYMYLRNIYFKYICKYAQSNMFTNSFWSHKKKFRSDPKKEKIISLHILSCVKSLKFFPYQTSVTRNPDGGNHLTYKL